MTDLRRSGPALFLLSLLGSLLSACGNSGGGTPTTPTPTVTLSGAVTDNTTGAAIAGAAVAISGKSATTGADGRYSIAGLAAGAATLTVQHQGHNNFSQSVTLAGSATTADVKMTTPLVALASGNWAGSWRNTTFGTTGTMTATLTANTIAQTMQIVLDVNGNVFGAGDPPPDTFTGSYTPGATGTLTGTSPRFGTVSVTLSSTGTFTGSCTNIPVAGVSRMDFNGSFAGATASITYTITFTSGGTAVGTATLTRS